LDIGDDDLKLEMEITAADYLPDDILAVPAYADLGFVVEVTAAAGAYLSRRHFQAIAAREIQVRSGFRG
jgi:hypothetical protein